MTQYLRLPWSFGNIQVIENTQIYKALRFA